MYGHRSQDCYKVDPGPSIPSTRPPRDTVLRIRGLTHALSSGPQTRAATVLFTSPLDR